MKEAWKMAKALWALIVGTLFVVGCATDRGQTADTETVVVKIEGMT